MRHEKRVSLRVNIYNVANNVFMLLVIWCEYFLWLFAATLSTLFCLINDGIYFCFLSFRRFGTKCGGCAQGISPNDLVRRAKSKVFHLNCFTCMMCNKQLSTGEEMYILDEFKFVCKEDYLSNSNGKDTTLLSGMEHNMTWTTSQLGTSNPCLYFYIFLKPLVNHYFLICPIALYSIYLKKM